MTEPVTPSPYLLGADWIVRLAETNKDLPGDELVMLLRGELALIEQNPNFVPDTPKISVQMSFVKEIFQRNRKTFR